MSTWGFWEFLSFGGIAFAALILAINEAIRQSDIIKGWVARLPRRLRGAYWSFVPLVLMIVAATVFIARDAGWIGTKAAIKPGPAVAVPVATPIPQTGGPLITGSVPTSVVVAPEYSRVGWIAAASSQDGKDSKQNPEKILEYIRVIHPTYNLADGKVQIIWSSHFVDWSFNRVGITGPRNRDAFAWKDWGKRSEYEPGCVVTLHYQGYRHVAFIVREVRPDIFEILGGYHPLSGDDKTLRGVSFVRVPKKDFAGECRLPS